MPHRSAASSDEWLHERSQIRNKSILPAGQVVNLAAGARVLVFENCHFTLIAGNQSFA